MNFLQGIHRLNLRPPSDNMEFFQELLKGRRERRFSKGCAVSVGRQCLEAIEELHRIGFVHRYGTCVITYQQKCCSFRTITCLRSLSRKRRKFGLQGRSKYRKIRSATNCCIFYATLFATF